ncbi:DUF2911 domain-containing protein [Aureivirga sp. CE67]|uniref:DUF2911 domain-containing protein n=1 Tax=Aureivirga sp. CE67 TaxID=1788983 RepID=UPI0018CBB3C5|nr:DUF2911 domain-containing protein [Aureivirga sp. CE67]
MFKKIATIFLIAASISTADAQITTPQPSPKSSLEQIVGISEITVDYSRPATRGRKIFGGLVPYGKLWRTGANNNTKVTFNSNVSVEGESIKKGAYALYTIPNESDWEIIFYEDTDNWGLPRKWDESKVAAKFRVPTMKIANAESFTIDITDINMGGATMNIYWATTKVSFKVTVPTSELVTESINEIMSGPSAADYASAARFYFDSGKDTKKALEWMNKALELGGEKFWLLRQKSLMQAKLGDYKEAIVTAKRSLKLAKENKNDDYVKMNEDSIKEWRKK